MLMFQMNNVSSETIVFVAAYATNIDAFRGITRAALIQIVFVTIH